MNFSNNGIGAGFSHVVFRFGDQVLEQRLVSSDEDVLVVYKESFVLEAC